MTSVNLISRDEVLRGLPAGRAQTLLYLIEARTAHAAARAQQTADLFPSEAEAESLDQAYLQSIALSRDLPRQPTIQEIEQYAPVWKELVPASDQMHAALAHLLGKKYQFTARATPAIRAALRLDTSPVQEAYLQYYGQPLGTIYTPRVTLSDRLRWAIGAIGNWVDTLPPFQQTCVLMIAMSFPQAALALSIALAGVGPLIGIGLIILFGLVNMVTVAALAEAVTRNGTIRYGNAFLGRVAADYLGPSGSMVMTLAVGVFGFLGEIAAFVGIAKTLAGFTPIPTVVWAAALFGINIFRLARQSLKLSLIVSLIMATTVIALLTMLSAFALTNFHFDYFSMNTSDGTRAEIKPALLQALLGVLLTAYYGHIFVTQIARVVLPREPSGRALINGSVASIGILTLIFVVWELAVTGVVSPQALAGTAGTVLTPLASALGPGAGVLGSLVVILLPGLASIRAADVLFNLVRERLSAARPQTQSTRRLSQRGRLLLSMSPVIVAFLIAEWMLLTGSGSFARIVSISGVMAVSLFAGVLPTLMLAASRRKGDFVPKTVSAILGHPLVLGAIYALFLGIILAHGLVIWQTPLERGMALALGAGIVALTVHLLRSGAFRPRAVIELRHDLRGGGQGSFTLTAVGQPLRGGVEWVCAGQVERCNASDGAIANFAQVRKVTFYLPATAARELKVWAHRVTLEGNSERLQVTLQVVESGATYSCELQPEGFTVLPVRGQECQVQITLASDQANK